MTPLFTNWANITSQPDSVLVSFGYNPGGKQAVPVTMVSMTPAFLKQLQAAVDSAVIKHEREFGHISDGSIALPKAVSVN